MFSLFISKSCFDLSLTIIFSYFILESIYHDFSYIFHLDIHPLIVKFTKIFVEMREVRNESNLTRINLKSY